MRASRFAYYATVVFVLVVALAGIARAQSIELASFFEVDPTLALHGFAVFSGAIVLLFETCRSRP